MRHRRLPNPLTEVELERWRRIRLSLAAYAYEFENDTIMSDHDFDEMSKLIDVSVKTGNSRLDSFFKREFNPCTGMWIRSHPELHKLRHIYHRYIRKDQP